MGTIVKKFSGFPDIPFPHQWAEYRCQSGCCYILPALLRHLSLHAESQYCTFFPENRWHKYFPQNTSSSNRRPADGIPGFATTFTRIFVLRFFSFPNSSSHCFLLDFYSTIVPQNTLFINYFIPAADHVPAFSHQSCVSISGQSPLLSLSSHLQYGSV